MAWQDRDYNRGWGGGEDYLSNPAAILGFSVPFGTWFGVRVRLHFWLILAIVLGIADFARRVSPLLIGIGIALMLLTLLIHDFAHRVAAQSVGGSHDEFMLWPAGGLIFPMIPPGEWPMFVTYVGPMVVHGVIAVVCMTVAGESWLQLPLNPLAGLGWNVLPPMMMTARQFLFVFALDNWLLLLVTLLPYFWFDGGCLWQSILWPMTGEHRAINVDCIVGMVLAVPMFFLSLSGGSLMGMLLWALLFSSSYTRRKQLKAEGPDSSLAAAIAFSAQDKGPVAGRVGYGAGPRGRKWFQKDFAQQAAKRNAAIRREREKIDRILAKVSEKGMHSLNWWEKRALRVATERQRRGEK